MEIHFNLFQWNASSNFNEMPIDINLIYVFEIAMKYQWKSIGNRVAISMKYKWKFIGNLDRIHLRI